MFLGRVDPPELSFALGKGFHEQEHRRSSRRPSNEFGESIRLDRFMTLILEGDPTARRSGTGFWASRLRRTALLASLTLRSRSPLTRSPPIRVTILSLPSPPARYFRERRRFASERSRRSLGVARQFADERQQRVDCLRSHPRHQAHQPYPVLSFLRRLSEQMRRCRVDHLDRSKA